MEPCPEDTWAGERGLRRHLEEDHDILVRMGGDSRADEHMMQFLNAGKYFEHHH
jgi:hypothetical protein